MNLDYHFEAVMAYLEHYAQESARFRKAVGFSQEQFDEFLEIEQGSVAVLERM